MLTAKGVFRRPLFFYSGMEAELVGVNGVN
jgi:hypothetical protein